MAKHTHVNEKSFRNNRLGVVMGLDYQPRKVKGVSVKLISSSMVGGRDRAVDSRLLIGSNDRNSENDCPPVGGDRAKRSALLLLGSRVRNSEIPPSTVGDREKNSSLLMGSSGRVSEISPSLIRVNSSKSLGRGSKVCVRGPPPSSVFTNFDTQHCVLSGPAKQLFRPLFITSFISIVCVDQGRLLK